MRSLRIIIIVVLLWGDPQPAQGQSRPKSDPLAARLEAVLESRPLARARVSALVVRDADGEVLFAHDPDRSLIPASNLKILTAIAALDAFGPAHRFQTRVLSEGRPDADGAVGELYLVGGGDPALNSEDWWRLASELRHRGLRHVSGDIVFDDTILDGQRWHPSWGKTSSRAYHAPVGGLTANYGSFRVTVTGGAKSGDPVKVAVDPPVPYLAVSNRARTGPPGVRSTLSVDRVAGEGREWITVEGVVPAGSQAQDLYRSVLDPAAYAASVFRWQLEANGIRVEGGLRRGFSPAKAVELIRFDGRSVGEIVMLFVKFSNNAVAETLVKSIGYKDRERGTWDDGVPAFRARLEEMGVHDDGVVLVDGSGLSYLNQVSARAVVRALRIADDSFRVGPELRAALPLAGEDGTLRRRAPGAQGQVRAKTGLLTRVVGLSGYAELEDGSSATFSILVNGYRGSDEDAMAALDRFVTELVTTAPPRTRYRKFGR